MAYIKEYWENKENLASKAYQHTIEMKNKYLSEIELSILNTKIYDTKNVLANMTNDQSCEKTIYEVKDLDSVNALFDVSDKSAVLNFASYKNPGGMFLNGSKAQEECLCHDSFLYNVLEAFKDNFYAENCKHKNRALYYNRALYSPNVFFFKNNQTITADVITCACPNKSAAQKYGNVKDEENTKYLKSRIKFVLEIAKQNHIKSLILGAYGCGVFGQDPKEVSKIFKEYLTTTYNGCFKEIIFAIPNKESQNYKAFEEIFANLYKEQDYEMGKI